MTQDRCSLISLFAGAGGLDIGLERAGFETLAINEIEPHACQTLRENKQLSLLTADEFAPWFAKQLEQRALQKASPQYIARLRDRLRNGIGRAPVLAQAQVLERDVRALSATDLLSAAKVRLGELTLIAGGPPCQPFSRAGKRETVDVSDGRLFLEFVRLVREIRPRWFLFENVKGLAQSRTTVVRAHCSSCHGSFIVPFEERGEILSTQRCALRCRHCGQPCSLDEEEVRGGSLEIIINEFESIGYKCKYKVLNAADYGVPQNRERLFIVGSRDNEAFSWPRPTHQTELLSASVGQLNFELGARLQSWNTVRKVLWQSGHPDFGPLPRESAVLWVKNVVRPHDEPVTWSLDRPSPTVGAHQAAKLAIAPYGVPDEQLRRQQWHTLGRRQKDLPPVEVVHAYLSDDELLQLQTFPPSWYLHGTRMERAFQIGNAVPPILATAVGMAIRAACAPLIAETATAMSIRTVSAAR